MATIGIDGSEAFVENKTGVENYAYQIILGLSKIDTKNNYIIYLDPRVNGSTALTTGSPGGKWPSNFQFKFLAYPLMWTQLGLGVETYKKRLDLLFIPSHTLPLLKNPFLKSVVTVHDLGAEYLPSLHSLKQQLYLGLMTKIQLQNASKLIAVSNATKKDIQKRVGISSGKIKVIYEGFNSELKNQNIDIVSKVLNRYEIKNNRYFLFVGTIQPRKNLVNLIKGYAKYYSPGKPKLVLAGSKGWLSDEIYKLPEELKIGSQVIFTGRVSDVELSSLYQNAIALVYPSLFEGFGLPILEAFNFNLPVITSDVSSMPEVAGDAALYIDPKSVDQIAGSLEKVENDKKLRDNLIKRGKIQLKKFSWEKAAKETLELFEEVING